MGHLELGPAMFFVLSAFLLYQPFVTSSFAGRIAPNAKRFLKARAFRVIPAYWVALTLLVIFFRANPNDPFSGGIKIDGWQDCLAVALFAQVYFPKWFFHGITSAYTLDAEVIFYIFLPVYALVVRRWCRGRSPRREAAPGALRTGRARGAGSFAWRTILEVALRRGAPHVHRCATRPPRVRGHAVVPRLRRLFRDRHGRGR